MNAHSARPVSRRKNLLPPAAAFLLLLVAACGFVISEAQSDEKGGREVADKIPKHLPIKVRIKKPEKLKDERNEDWPDYLEIEVTNTGAKPIYFLSIDLDLPDVLAENGLNFGLDYMYGRGGLIAFEEPVRPDDVPLMPGETITLKPPDAQLEGMRELRKKGKVTKPKKLDFIFQLINFGDGTGFMGRSGTPMPIKREQSWNPSRARGSGQAVGTADPPPRAPADPARAPNPARPPVSFLRARAKG